jgi:hypothetical protein
MYPPYLPDPALVQRLAAAKLAEVVDVMRAEGWEWVIAETMCDHATHYRRI